MNVPVPVLGDDGQRTAVWDALRSRKLEETHHLVEVDGAPAVDELRARGIDVRSMGRGIDDDPAFFLAAGAAGVLAGRLAAENRRWRRVGRLIDAARSGAGGDRSAGHMWAISCSTRSSTDLNGSLQSTVRCAWSLSFRCTQSTV